MIFKKYVSSISNVFAENRLLKFVILLLAILLVFSLIQNKSLVDSRRTILIPMGLSETVSVGSSYADETYLNAMGIYIATLTYSTTPQTVQAQYRILTGMFTPEAYSRYSSSIMTAALGHIKNEMAQSMRVNKITTEQQPKPRIIISIGVDKYIFGKRTENTTQNIKLAIDFEMVNGKFYITAFEEEK